MLESVFAEEPGGGGSKTNRERTNEALRGATKWHPREKLEAQGGIEPPMKVLQTFALPLGYCGLEARSAREARREKSIAVALYICNRTRARLHLGGRPGCLSRRIMPALWR